jgi:hypothetical protein
MQQNYIFMGIFSFAYESKETAMVLEKTQKNFVFYMTRRVALIYFQ